MDQVIAINENVVEQLEESYRDLGFQEPQISLDDKLDEYIESLKSVEDHYRESKVEKWIKSQLDPILSEWRSKYSQNTELLKKANAETRNLENAKKMDQTKLDTLQSRINDFHEKKEIKQEEFTERKRNELNVENIDLKYEKMKATMLLVFSFVVAIGTYIYFAQAQIDIKWATMSNADKVAKVKTLITEYRAMNQYSAFSDVLVDPDTNKVKDLNELTISDLYAIDESIINKAADPTLGQFMRSDPSTITLAFSAFLLILLGKVTATVYEKLNMPNWMYYLLFLFAAIILVGAVTSTAMLGEKKIKRTTLSNKISEISFKIKELEDMEDVGFGEGYDNYGEDENKIQDPKIKELIQSLERLNQDFNNICESIGAFKFITMLLFMFAEIVVGSLAWISYSEFVAKRIKVNSGSKGILELITQEIEDISTLLSELGNKKKKLTERISLATNLENRIEALKSKLHSKDEIYHISQQYLNKEMANGEALLQIAKAKWSNSDM